MTFIAQTQPLYGIIGGAFKDGVVTEWVAAQVVGWDVHSGDPIGEPMVVVLGAQRTRVPDYHPFEGFGLGDGRATTRTLVAYYTTTTAAVYAMVDEWNLQLRKDEDGGRVPLLKGDGERHVPLSDVDLQP